MLLTLNAENPSRALAYVRVSSQRQVDEGVFALRLKSRGSKSMPDTKDWRFLIGISSSKKA